MKVINSLEAGKLNRLSVLSLAGAVAGVIDRGNIVRTVEKKLNMAITQAEIKRIKSEGSYPQELQLQAIALNVGWHCPTVQEI